MPTDVPSPDFSWATAAPRSRPTNPVRRAAAQLRDAQFFDALVVLLFLAVFDVVILLILSGWQSVQCGGYCSLRTQARLFGQGLVLVPSALLIPPLLVSVLMRRRRVLVLVVQLLLCAALTLHNLAEQRTLNQRIHGTAPCWSPDYSPKDCPWGVK
jgi:hypothetical protein